MKLPRSFPVPCLAFLLISLAAATVKSDAGGGTETSRAINRAAPEEKPRASAVAEDLARLREQWVKELHDKQLDEITAHYAPDAAFLECAIPIRGRGSRVHLIAPDIVSPRLVDILKSRNQQRARARTGEVGERGPVDLGHAEVRGMMVHDVFAEDATGVSKPGGMLRSCGVE